MAWNLGFPPKKACKFLYARNLGKFWQHIFGIITHSILNYSKYRVKRIVVTYCECEVNPQHLAFKRSIFNPFEHWVTNIVYWFALGKSAFRVFSQHLSYFFFSPCFSVPVPRSQVAPQENKLEALRQIPQQPLPPRFFFNGFKTLPLANNNPFEFAPNLRHWPSCFFIICFFSSSMSTRSALQMCHLAFIFTRRHLRTSCFVRCAL